jgi:hypothetical protein
MGVAISIRNRTTNSGTIMRATTPRDSIGSSGHEGPRPINQPKVAVGTKLDLSKVVDYNKEYHIRTVRRRTIRRHRKTIDGMRRDGYFEEMRGKKMLDCHKEQIRDIFRFMETADSVIVAGAGPYSLSHDHIVNQCYVDGSYSFLHFNYYLMFRKNIDGKELVYTYPEPLLGEGDVLRCVIPEPVGPAA